MLTCPICGDPIAKPNSCVAIDDALKAHVDALYHYQVGAMPSFLMRIRAADSQLVKMHLRGFKTVLEIGATDGWLTRQLTDHHDVLALDYSAHPVTGLGAKGAWHTLQTDLTDLSMFPDAKFDALIINHGLHLFPHPVDYARDVRRLVRPGGIILLLNLIFHHDPSQRIQQLKAQAAQFEAAHHMPYLIKPSRGYLNSTDHAGFIAAGFKIKPYPAMWKSWFKAQLKPTAPLYSYGIHHIPMLD